MFKFKLDEFIASNQTTNGEALTRNMVAREAKVRPNVIYEMCDNETKRIELKTLEKILTTLTILTGKQVNVQDVFEYQYDKEPSIE